MIYGHEYSDRKIITIEQMQGAIDIVRYYRTQMAHDLIERVLEIGDDFVIQATFTQTIGSGNAVVELDAFVTWRKDEINLALKGSER